MRLFPEQLGGQLQKALAQCYLIFGNEPLLKQESIDSLMHHAKQQGFLEKHSFDIEAQMDWQPIYDSCQTLSLFANKQIILLNFPDSGINQSQTAHLKSLAALLNPDILLIINGPRLNQKQESAQWFMLFKQQGVYVVCNTPDIKQMPNFIKRRCDNLGLKLDAESTKLLALWHEGNLLALSQSLMKLQLLFPDGNLTLPRLQDALSPHHHFTPFQLIDALIEGKAKRAVRILRQQEAEGVEITLLLRIVQKELIQLYKMQERLNSGSNLSKTFDHFRVWQQKRFAYSQALHRLPLPYIAELVNYLSQIEIVVKMDFSNQPWAKFTELCLKICMPPLAN